MIPVNTSVFYEVGTEREGAIAGMSLMETKDGCVGPAGRGAGRENNNNWGYRVWSTVCTGRDEEHVIQFIGGDCRKSLWRMNHKYSCLDLLV